MGAVRHWRRATLGGAGVALLLPLAVGVALLGSAAVGGQHTLGSLGQVLAGPSAPGLVRGATKPGLESARAVPPLPAGPRVRAATAARSGASGTSAPVLGGGGSGVRQRQSGSGGPSAGINTPAPHRPGSAHAPPSVPTSPGTGGGSGPAPPPQGSAVHAVGQQVADTAKGLPAPVGPAAGDAVQTVVDLLP